jgi:hypothetical protein
MQPTTPPTMPLPVAAIVVLVVLLVAATLLYLQRKRLGVEVAKGRRTALLKIDDEFFKIGDGDDDAYSLADSNFEGPHIIIER